MSRVDPSAVPKVQQRATELFHEHCQRIHRQTDRAFAILLVAQWLAGIALALVVAPRTWIGQFSQIHVHVWAAIALGGMIALPAAACGWWQAGRLATRHMIAAAQMLCSALLIHLTGGRIETHFHVFGSLAFLAFYRDWRVLLTATLVVAADHYFRGVYWPQSVFGVVSNSHWRWLEHAWWVLFEDAFLFYGLRRGERLLREVSTQRAELEITNDLIERAVVARTAELAAANRTLQANIEERLCFERELESARDAADAASRAKSQFLANMSHEVRTPINGIMGMNNLMLDTQLDEQQRTYADIIRQCSASLLAVVNDVLDYSRIESGRVKLHELPFAPADSMREAVEIFRTAAEAKHLRLGARTDSTLPLRVVADASRVRQVLLNLLSNAVKFTAAGEIAITARARPAERPAGEIAGTVWHELEFSVRDTGAGIPVEQRDALFKVFSQVDPSMTRRHGGTGLGLVIARRLVELMRGRIWFESEVGQGSTFHFTILVRAANAAAAGPAGESLPDRMTEAVASSLTATQLLADAFPLRILLTEDNSVNQLVAARLLARLGYDCEIAHHGIEALAALERQAFDLVLMDVQMPEMDGLEATREIVRRHPAELRPEIVAVTAHASADDRESCFAAGMDDYLTKPISPAVLEQKLKAAAQRLGQRRKVALTPSQH